MKRISTLTLFLITVHLACAQNTSSYPVQNPPGCKPVQVTIQQYGSPPYYTLIAAPGSGQAPYTYLWSTGDTTQRIDFIKNAATFKHIEAENFYSSVGVATEPTTDVGGGKDVGYIDSSDALLYWDTIPSSGIYTIRFRVATPADNASFKLTDEGNMEFGRTLATVKIPNTGGFQNWVTISQDVYLPAGVDILYLTSSAPKNNSWNINWLEVIQKTKPGSVHIEAEDWRDMNGVVAEPTTDMGGGKDVGYIDPGDLMQYALNVPAAGIYGFSFRVASPASHASFEVRNAQGQTLATVSVPNTGGYQRWTTVHGNLTLPAGPQELTLVSTSPMYNPWNINWLELTGAPVISTTHVEGENFSAMSGVVNEPTTDAGGGMDVGYIDPGDWMDYQVNAPKAGYYGVSFRVASPNASTFHVLNAKDSILAWVDVPVTGGFQSWTTVYTRIYLAQGAQKIRLLSTGAPYHDWNLNWFEIYGDAPSSTDLYTVVVTDANGCKGYASIDLQGMLGTTPTTPTPAMRSQPALKPAATDNALAMTASPNPSSSYFTLQLKGKPSTPSTVIIYNQTGTVMEKIETLTGKTITVGTSYPRGSYYAELIQGDKRSTVKLMKL